MKIFTGLFFQILFPVLFAICLAASFHFYQAKNTNTLLIFGFLSWIFVGLAIIAFLKSNVNLEGEFSGTILPDNQVRPITQYTSNVPEDAYLLLLGNSVAWSQHLPIDILKIRNDSVISIREENGELLLSAKFFDRSNTIIAKLIDNQWHINPNNYFRKERPNKSQLKIYDQSDDEILNLIYMNPKTIKITGIFRHRYLREPIIFDEDRAVLPMGIFYGFSFGNIGSTAISIN